ncbi:MAG: hypothetical protein BWY74_00157 [Firmicutes bacterium ADurb.Bin419]|nr:MAG: hypothetical protein BWY74_00157 [Firmicutes bacterium ADurb.Bin419]
MSKNKTQKEFRIATLVPTRGLIFTKTITAIMRENALCGQYPAIFSTTDLPLPHSRNALVEDALASPHNFTHLLLVDDDIIIPENGLKAMLELDADIAFIDYPMHYAVGKWKNMSTACRDNWLPGEEWRDKPIVWAGLGCTLVKREVFEKLDKPWFVSGVKSFIRDSKTGKVNLMDATYPGEPGGGEDAYFFIHAGKKKLHIAEVKGMKASHLRVEKFVLIMQTGKYKTQHKIKENSKIDQPYK